MSPSTLNIILMVPFALVFVATSLRFLLSGLRRGVWVALVYLGITLAVAGIAIPLARLLAPTVWGLLEPVLAEHLPQELTQLISEGADVAVNIVGTLAAMVVYPILFFLLCLIARLVAGIFLKPLLTNRKTWSRAVGAGVGCVHAVLYPLILLLPLYGTLAAFAPTVQVVMESREQPDRQTLAYVEKVAQNPVVQLAGIRPIQWFYGNLSKVSIQDSSLNVADAAVATGDLLVLFRDLENAPPSQRSACLRELNAYARDHVLDAPWFYTLVVEVGLDQAQEMTDDSTVSLWLASLEGISREDFRKTMLAVSDFCDVLLIGGRLERIDTARELLRDEILMVQLETTLQATPQTEKLRELALVGALESFMFDGDHRASRLFVTEVLKNPQTRQLFNMRTVCGILRQGSTSEIADYLLAHDQINTDELSRILTENDLLDKVELQRSLAPAAD